MDRMAPTIDEKRYGRLLAKALPAVIRTEEENEKTLIRIAALMDKGGNRSPEEDRLLDLLARLAADFETAKHEFGASKPHEVLSFLLDKRGMNQVDLLPVLGCSEGALSDILSGRREIARSTATKLAEFFRLPIDLFI